MTKRPTSAFTKVLLIVAAFAAMLTYWHLFPPRNPIASADGVYWNSCCGSISLHRGEMRVAGRAISYVVEHDKNEQPYVLPSKYVGVFNGNRVEISRSRAPLMLDIDDAAMTPTIRLFGDDGKEYLFEIQKSG